MSLIGTLLRDLTADAAPTSDDLVYLVNDPAGTPGNRKVTVGNLATSAAFSALYASLAGLPELVQDAVAAMILNGAGLTLTYDDTAGTLTVSATRQSASQRLATPTEHPALVQFAQAFASRASAPVVGLWIADSEAAFAFVNRGLNTAVSDVMNPPESQLSSWNATGTWQPGDSIFGVGGSGGAGTKWTSTTGVTQNNVSLDSTRPGSAVAAHLGIAGNAVALANLQDLNSIATVFQAAEVRWLAPLSGAGATLDVLLDGVVVTTVAADVAGRVTVTPATPGSHTIGLVSHGVTLVDTVELTYGGNATAGWRPYAAAHTGYTTADFNACAELAGYIASVNPAVVFLETATNDASAAAYFADMGTLIDTVQANSNASVVITLPNATLGDTTWEQYRYYARRLADTKGAYLIELSEVMPDLSAPAAETLQPWARSGAAITVTTADHGLSVGDSVVIAATTSAGALPNGTYSVVSTPSSSTYTITGLAGGAGSGTATTTRYRFTTDGVHYSTVGRAIFGAAVFSGMFGGPAFDYRAVDGFGRRYALESAWRGITTFAGSPGVARIRDSAQGGMEVAFFLNDTDTQPIVRLGSAPNIGLNGIRAGAGGSTAVDAFLVRTRPAVWAVTDSIQFGSSGVVTGVRAATAAALPACTYANGTAGVGATLTGNTNGALADQDFVTLVFNDRLLVKNQASGFQNGIYKVTQVGTAGTPFILTRASGADQAADYVGGIFCMVAEGIAYRDSMLVSSPSTVVMGTTVITWGGLNRPNATPTDAAWGSNRDRRRYWTDFEEIQTAIVAAGTIPGTSWHLAMGGAGAAPSATQVAATEPGVIDLATGAAVATGYIYVRPSTIGFTFDTAKRWSLYARAKTPTATAVGQTFRSRIGAYVVLTAAAETDGIYFELPADGSTIKAICMVGSVATTVDTTITQGTANRAFLINYDPVTATAYFYIGSTLVASIATNLPSGVALSCAAGLNKATGTTSMSLRVDAMSVDIPDARSLLPLIP